MTTFCSTTNIIVGTDYRRVWFCKISTSGATKLSTTRLIWIIAVVPISAATIALASGNLLALGTLEALEATSTLRIRVALSPTCFQVFGFAVVAATQRYISGVVRSAVVRPLGIVAVVPIFAATCAFASGNRLAIGTLEALESVGAMLIIITLSVTSSQIFGVGVVRTGQHFDTTRCRVVAVVPVFTPACTVTTRDLLAFGALETLEPRGALRMRVAFAETCFQVFGTAVVATTKLFGAEWLFRGYKLFPIGVVAVIPILATTFAFATGNRLAIGTLEALESVPTMRIIIAFSETSFQVFGVGVVRTAQHFDSDVSGVVAVVPAFAAARAMATRDLLAFGALPM